MFLASDGCYPQTLEVLRGRAEPLGIAVEVGGAEQVSDATDRMIAAEITREQLYHQLHAELPYDSAIETEKYEERPDGSVAIHQQILVARDSQKAIVLGKGGRQIKAVGQAARAELEEILGCRVHLFLFVKVRPKWTEDPERYQELGLEFSG